MSSTQPNTTELMELDAQIAVKLFGWRWYVDSGGKFLESPDQKTGCHHFAGSDPEYNTDLPAYSSSPAAMMEVLDRMKAIGWLFDFFEMVPWPDPRGEKYGVAGGWAVNGTRYDLPGGWTHAKTTKDSVRESGATMPHALCRAALAAVQKNQEVRP